MIVSWKAKFVLLFRSRSIRELYSMEAVPSFICLFSFSFLHMNKYLDMSVRAFYFFIFVPFFFVVLYFGQ